MSGALTYARIALLAGAVGLCLYVMHLRGALHEARARAEAAAAARALAEQQTRVVDRYHTESRVIHEQTEREADALRETPGAAAPLDPVRRDALCAALGRLRRGAAACDGPGESARALPTGEGGAADDPG